MSGGSGALAKTTGWGPPESILLAAPGWTVYRVASGLRQEENVAAASVHGRLDETADRSGRRRVHRCTETHTTGKSSVSRVHTPHPVVRAFFIVSFAMLSRCTLRRMHVAAHATRCARRPTAVLTRKLLPDFSPAPFHAGLAGIAHFEG